MIVYKFGGTSVGSAQNMKKIVAIITADSRRKIVVLSAVSGTTNTLLQISNALQNKNFEEARTEIKNLKENVYEPLISDLFSTKNMQLKATEFVAAIFKDILQKGEDKKISFEKKEKFIVAQGEIISTNLFSLYLKEKSIDVSLVSALEFMQKNKNGEPVLEDINTKLNPILQQYNHKKIMVTQGFICKNHKNEIDNLERGGSDYTASLIGAAIQADQIQIWTDIDGMHNNDPRFVNNTFSIQKISFDEAAELAYFGAKILHPQSLIPAKEKNIPVWLKNTFNPSQFGTLISNNPSKKGVTAIAAKDKITAIKIKSYRMLLAYGFLKKIFEVFEKFTTPIDMITTSEVAVSLTIDKTKNLKAIVKELTPFGKIEIDDHLSIICIAGNFTGQNEGLSAKVLTCLQEIPIRMISYGGSNYNISVLVRTQDKIIALNSLNKGLFPG